MRAVLEAAGLSVHVYTSPHLVRFHERIRLGAPGGGRYVSEAALADAFRRCEEANDNAPITIFEITTAAALLVFAEHPADVLLLEVGLGGRFDATNVITQPRAAVVTPVSMDHAEFLGDTVAKIAAEKAGIIKANTPAVVGEYLPETLPVFEDAAEKKSAHLTFGVTAPARWVEKCALKGEYQKKNLGTLKAAIEALELKGYHFSEHLILEALQEVKVLTGLRGRWEILQERPMVIADTAHNSDGLKETMLQLQKGLKGKLHMVLGVVKEKDLSKILGLLPPSASYYFCKPNIFRGLDEEILAKEAFNYGLKGEIHDSVEKALTSAKGRAAENDTIYIGGSTFVVAEVL